jgi:hypothetical protein
MFLGPWPNGIVFGLRVCNRCEDLVTIAERTWEGYGAGGKWVVAPTVLPVAVGSCPVCREPDELVAWGGDFESGGPCPHCRAPLVMSGRARVD